MRMTGVHVGVIQIPNFPYSSFDTQWGIDYISDNDWHAYHRQRKSQKAQKENNVQPQTELKEKRC